MIEHVMKHSSIVVFLADIYEDKRAIIPLSACFHRLRLSVSSAIADKHMTFKESQIQLQIVPLSWISSDPAVSIANFTLARQGRLAFEVYESFPNSSRTEPLSLGSSTRPFIELDKTSPWAIPFDLTETPPSQLLSQDAVLHVAYAQSVRKDWLVASLIDNHGHHEHTTTYSLKHFELSAIVTEIWETILETLDMSEARKLRWRIIITKTGVLLQDELAIWKQCFSKSDRPNVSLTLLSVNTTPKFSLSMKELSEPKVHPQPTTQSSPVANLSSPIATPTASAPTPTPEANATTTMSGPDSDPSARLTDPTHQSWVLILAFQPNTASIGTYSPSLASGLLLKRREPSNAVAPACMQVNLMHMEYGKDMKRRLSLGLVCAKGTLIPGPGVDSQQHTRNEILKDAMRMFRNLVSLGRARGELGKDDTRPLHVARVCTVITELEELISL